MPSTVVTVGETMALVGLPDHGLLRPGTPPAVTIGGAESNVCLAAVRLGVPVTWIGRLGDDDLGRLVRRELLGQGVTVRAATDPGAPTGLMVKEHRRGRPSAVRYYRAGSAGSRLQPDDIDPDVLADAGVLHVTGITAALGPSALSTLRHAVEMARAAAVPVSFDVNHRATLWTAEVAGPILRELAEQSDIVFASPEEGALLFPDTTDAVDVDGAPDPWAAAAALGRAILALGPRLVVIKLGERGALAVTADGEHAHPIEPIVPVDAVGAGDAFVGAFLAEHVSGRPLPACLAGGARMAALVCAVRGDWEGTLDWDAAFDPAAEVRR